MRLTLTHAGCDRTHHSHASLAACQWPDAAWVTGSGSIAFLAHCGMLSIQLFADWDTAQRRFDAVSDTRCSNECVGRHEIVELRSLRAAVPARQ